MSSFFTNAWRRSLLLLVLPLAIAGGFLGAYLTGHLPADVLRRCFGGLLVAAGIYTIFFR